MQHRRQGACCGASSRATRRGARRQTAPILDRLVGYAVAYYRDFVQAGEEATARRRAEERAALEDLAAALDALPADADAEAIQNEVYEVGKRHGFANLRDWFKALYEVAARPESRARAWARSSRCTACRETIALIRRALAGENLAVA